MLQYIITQSNGVSAATIILKNKPVAVSSADPRYAKIEELLKRPGTKEDDIEAVLFADARRIEEAILSEGDFALEHGVLAYKGLKLPSTLSDRMLTMAREGFDVVPLKLFVENLAQNPSFRVFQQLYGFLEYGKMALTPDGCFLAYKKVRGDYRDIHSGKFDNSVGQVLAVPRLTVDDNPQNTCSSGLHVCSYDYLNCFGGSVDSGYHVVACKVNPRDVVSVPVDYNNTKMRVCGYEVVSEVDDYVKADNNVLASSSVSDGETFTTFIVEERSSTGDWVYHSGYSDLGEAEDEADNVSRDHDSSSGYTEVSRVRNAHTGKVITTYSENDD